MKAGRALEAIEGEDLKKRLGGFGLDLIWIWYGSGMDLVWIWYELGLDGYNPKILLRIKTKKLSMAPPYKVS